MALDPEDLGPAELLATLLDPKPQRGERVASAILDDVGGLAALARLDVTEIEEALARAEVARAPRLAVRIATALELGRRLRLAEATPPARFRDTRDVVAWAEPRLGALVHEELWMLALDGQGGLRAARCVARGGVHGIGVRATDPLRLALRAGATGFALVHNHPSGDPTPSPEDLTFTRRVADAARVVGLPLVDHVVVARNAFASVPLEGDVA